MSDLQAVVSAVCTSAIAALLGKGELVTESGAFASARRNDVRKDNARTDSGSAAVMPHSNESLPGRRVSRGGSAPGLLRPSQIPVTGGVTSLTVFSSPAGGRASRQRLRPSGALLRTASGRVRPSAVPVRPLPDAARDPGRPLAAPLAEEMGARLGADLSDVRVHTGSAAQASAAELGARAYTWGSHVVIGDGGADKHTLAHELTHVLQQRQGPVGGVDDGHGFKTSDPFDTYERDAEANATRVMRVPPSEEGQAAPPYTTGNSWPSVQRTVENATYNTKDKALKKTAKDFFDLVNDAVQTAYEYVVSVPSLGPLRELDGHTWEWCRQWGELMTGGKPATMAAAFGYAVESLVGVEESPYAIKVPTDYAIYPQFVSGGTRPDLVLRLQKGDDDIAWVDVTASKSADHIFQKEAWDKKVAVFAEVTYPSLDDAAWGMMIANKDNKSAIDPAEFKKKQEAARKRTAALKAHWKETGINFRVREFNAALTKVGLSKELRGLGPNPQKVRDYIAKVLGTAFSTAPPREQMVPSILAALQVSPVSWGYGTGYNENERAGEIWLSAHDPNLPPEEEAENLSPMEEEKELILTT